MAYKRKADCTPEEWARILEKERLKKARYYAENPEKYRAKTAKYRKENPSRVKQIAKDARERHKDSIKEYRDTYYKNNREYFIEHSKEYASKHPEKVKEWRDNDLPKKIGRYIKGKYGISDVPSSLLEAAAQNRRNKRLIKEMKNENRT